MVFEFIDNNESVIIIADNKRKEFPKNYFYIDSNPFDNIIKIFSIEHRVLYTINLDVDTTNPSFATKDELLDFLSFFFKAIVIDTNDLMLKSVYDVDNDGVVDSAKEIYGSTTPLQYYGTDLTNTKGFYDLPSGNGTGDMTKAVYDTNNNGVVDVSESVSGLTNPLDYYGTDDTNTKGFYSLPQAVGDILQNNPVEIGEALVISSNIYPPIITTNENNYFPLGFETASVIYIQSNGNYIITGLEKGVDGRVIFLSNIGNNQIKLADNDPNSLPENRFFLNVDVIMKPSNGVVLLYSEQILRWTVLNIS